MDKSKTTADKAEKKQVLDQEFSEVYDDTDLSATLSQTTQLFYGNFCLFSPKRVEGTSGHIVSKTDWVHDYLDARKSFKKQEIIHHTNGLTVVKIVDLAMKFCWVYFDVQEKCVKICLDPDLKQGPYPIWSFHDKSFKIADSATDQVDLKHLKEEISALKAWYPKDLDDFAAKKAFFEFHNKKYKVFKAARDKGEASGSDPFRPFAVEVKPRAIPAALTRIREVLQKHAPLADSDSDLKTFKSKHLIFYDKEASAVTALNALSNMDLDMTLQIIKYLSKGIIDDKYTYDK